MAKQYMFVAGGDACGACAALDGTISDGGLGQQHDNCQCQDVPVDRDDDCPTVEIENVSVQIRTGVSTTVSGDITVRCCDGSEIGESFELDLGPMSIEVNDALAEFTESAENAGAELAEGCPEDEPGGWVEDGEGAPG